MLPSLTTPFVLKLQVIRRAKIKRRKSTTGRNSRVVPGSKVGNQEAVKPKGKRIRDSAAKRQALILAALGLFASKGYEATTTREIAAAAECAEGLIHRYFKGKAGLLAALIECRTSPDKGIDSAHQLHTALNLEDEFLALVNQEVESVWENRDFFRVLIPRAIVDPAVGAAINKALVSARAKAIADRLQRCGSGTTLEPHAIDGLAQIVGLLGFAFGFVRPVLLRQDRARAKKMATTLARMFVNRGDNSLVA